MKLHDSRQLGPLVFRDPLLLCSALYFLLYFDASGFLRLGLLAAFLHECGHILMYCALLRRFPVIEVTMTGFCMRMDAPARGLSPGRLFWLAAAGPAVNFMLAGIWALRLEQELTSTDQRRENLQELTIRGSAFWAANLLTGGFNLLPVPPLDGAQLASCLCEMRRAGKKFKGND